MSSVFTAVIGAASLGASLYSANKAADATSKAADKAAGISQQGSAAQLRFLSEQAAQARQDQLPYSAGGANAYSEFLRQLGIAPATQGQLSGFSTSSNGQQGSYGSRLIPLPGISTSGVHSQQTNTQGPLGINTFGTTPLISGTSPDVRGGSGSSTGGLFYDPGAHMVVDGNGQSVAAIPKEGGVIPGLINGFNNPVSIDAQGNLIGMGSSGTNALGRLTPMTEAEKKAAQDAANGTGTGAMSGATGGRYGAYFASPGYNFLYDETMRSARAGGAARGSLYSGAMLKELQNRAAGVASQDYGSYMTRLSDASRIGQAAASGQAASSNALGQNGATVLGQAASDQANARLVSGASSASSIVGANNAFQGVLGGGLSALGRYYESKIPTTATPG